VSVSEPSVFPSPLAEPQYRMCPHCCAPVIDESTGRRQGEGIQYPPVGSPPHSSLSSVPGVPFLSPTSWRLKMLNGPMLSEDLSRRRSTTTHGMIAQLMKRLQDQQAALKQLDEGALVKHSLSLATSTRLHDSTDTSVNVEARTAHLESQPSDSARSPELTVDVSAMSVSHDSLLSPELTSEQEALLTPFAQAMRARRLQKESPVRGLSPLRQSPAAIPSSKRNAAARKSVDGAISTRNLALSGGIRVDMLSPAGPRHETSPALLSQTLPLPRLRSLLPVTVSRSLDSSSGSIDSIPSMNQSLSFVESQLDAPESRVFEHSASDATHASLSIESDLSVGPPAYSEASLESNKVSMFV
jgi:hypothetical protein